MATSKNWKSKTLWLLIKKEILYKMLLNMLVTSNSSKKYKPV